MRSKILVVILVMFLFLALVGCGVVTPTTDEVKIKGVISEYFLAIDSQNWNKAKNCCIYGSDRYYKTCLIEQWVNSLAPYCTVIINSIFKISDVSIHGNYAQAYINLTVCISIDSISNCETDSGYYYLQKISGSWRIYAP